jgi:predicted nuclease of restriction endonuclease-like (RecB) superfamily
MSDIISKDEREFITIIKEKIRKSQYNALKVVNVELINLYWEIGKSISDKQKENWGKSIVKTLSNELKNEFPGIKGFSISNLWNMAKFYNEYNGNEKLQPLVGEISWSKNILIMEKCKDSQMREFYILATKKFGWTKNLLLNQIENQTYEKYLLNQTNFDKTLPDDIKNQADLAVKDEYTFDFLKIPEKHKELKLEETLIKNIRNFLLEMGNQFAFISNQFKIDIDDEEYFIDLLLYHRQLKALVAIELKIGKFIPEYKGKMEFYLSVLNDKYKLEGENDAIGIIICKEKNRTVVEYSLNTSNMPIGVATYKTSKHIPNDFKELLPSQEEIAIKINNFFKNMDGD